MIFEKKLSFRQMDTLSIIHVVQFFSFADILAFLLEAIK